MTVLRITFTSGRKWTHSYDIECSNVNIKNIKRSDSEYYAEYSKCLKMEKKILKVFNEIRNVLEKSGVYLHLYNIHFGALLRLLSHFGIVSTKKSPLD